MSFLLSRRTFFVFNSTSSCKSLVFSFHPHTFSLSLKVTSAAQQLWLIFSGRDMPHGSLLQGWGMVLQLGVGMDIFASLTKLCFVLLE